MIGFFKYLFRPAPKTAVQQRVDDLEQLAEVSQRAFVSAATGTVNLAQDITETLRDRIDDYDVQIGATAEILSDALFMVDHRGTVETFNPAAERIFGWESRYIVGENMMCLLCLGDCLVDFPTMARIFDNPNSDSFKELMTGLRGRHRNGYSFHIDVRLNGFTRSDDSQHYLVLIRDITDIKQAQDKLQESEEHFRAFGQASSEAMMIHNSNGILSWNPRLSEMTGYSAREIARMDPLDFVHPMERDKVWDMHKDYDLARSYETLFLSKDGLQLEVAITGKPVEWKNEKARIKVIRDVTHLKDFEQILNISRERFRTLTDNTIDLVCSFNAQADIKIANHTFWEYFGIPMGTQCRLTDFVPEEDRDRVLAHVSKISADNPVARTLHRVVRGDEIRWLDCIDRAVFNADGELLEIQSVGRDVTDYIERK